MVAPKQENPDNDLRGVIKKIYQVISPFFLPSAGVLILTSIPAFIASANSIGWFLVSLAVSNFFLFILEAAHSHNLSSKSLKRVLYLLLSVCIIISMSFGIWKLLIGDSPKKDTLLTDAQLVLEAKQLAQELLAFSEYRYSHAPQVDHKNWDESTNRMIVYGHETNTIYDSKFKATALLVLDEFSKRNLTVKGFDRFYAEHPTNYIGFNTVASAIDELALKLEKSMK